MGEAKRKADAMRAMMLVECDQWSKPPSDVEKEALDEILALPAVEAVRASAHDLQKMGMNPKDCHDNCRWYAQNDPAGEWEHIFGWWKQPSALVLHSVICRADEYVCITPQADPAVGNNFTFIPDPAIALAQDGDQVVLLRNGQNHYPGLRLDPVATIEYMAEVRARLQSGMPPFKAWEIDYLGAQFDDEL